MSAMLSVAYLGEFKCLNSIHLYYFVDFRQSFAGNMKRALQR
jgi:hypothetical protein